MTSHVREKFFDHVQYVGLCEMFVWSEGSDNFCGCDPGDEASQGVVSLMNLGGEGLSALPRGLSDQFIDKTGLVNFQSSVP